VVSDTNFSNDIYDPAPPPPLEKDYRLPDAVGDLLPAVGEAELGRSCAEGPSLMPVASSGRRWVARSSRSSSRAPTAYRCLSRN
jgi:hypothetical protein